MWYKHFTFVLYNVQVVVVLSGSMEPGFQRGDILFLNMGSKPARTGEIVVFNIDGRDIPIVHRVIKVHERAAENHLDILTKVWMNAAWVTVALQLHWVLTTDS